MAIQANPGVYGVTTFPRRFLYAVSYVGHEDDEVDHTCGVKHGLIRLSEGMIHCNEDVKYVCISMYSLTEQEQTNMSLLIPDRTKESQEDFIWCIPIERVKWQKWYELSEKFKTVTPKAHGGVRYMNRMEGKDVKTVLVMPNQHQTDDDAMTSCAYLRLIKQFTCRMYVVRCTDDKLSTAQMINAVAGVDPALLTEVDDDEDEAKPEGENKA